jgi:hypothetical protein
MRGMSLPTAPLGGPLARRFVTHLALVGVIATGALAPSVARAQDSAPAESAPAPTPAPAPRASEGWDILDGVAIAVDDRIVSLVEYFDALEAASVRATTTTQAQQRELATAIVRGNVTRLLGERAGESLELSDLDIEARLRDWIREQREPKGSVNYGAELRRNGRDPLDELPRARRELLGHLWMQRELGGRNGPGRAMVDVFVRPGVMREQYPLWAEEQRAEFVELRTVEMLGDTAGGLDIALAILNEQREKILTGEVDMAVLAADPASEESLRESKGLIRPFPVSNLGDSELFKFVVDNPEGSVSTPIAWGRGGPASILDPVVGYRLFRIEKKTRAESAPPFGVAATQDELRRRVEERRERERRSTASDRLGQSSMVWIHPLVRQLLGETP